MAEDIDKKILHAKRQVSFWKRELTKLESVKLEGSEGRYPRIAKIKDSFYRNRVYVVLGRVDHTAYNNLRDYYPGYMLDLKTRKTVRHKTGWDLFHSDDPTDAEPDWLSDEEEMMIAKDFPKSAWAKKIIGD